MGIRVRTDFAFDVIYATIILHNLAIRMKDYIEPSEDSDLDDSSSDSDDDDDVALQRSEAQVTQAGKSLRDMITQTHFS